MVMTSITVIWHSKSGSIDAEYNKSTKIIKSTIIAIKSFKN